MDPTKAAEEILGYLNYQGVFPLDNFPNLQL